MVLAGKHYMRILIQDPSGTGYFDGESWTGDAEHAKVFESVAQAETFCRAQNVTRALIVVKFKDPAQDIRYPVGPRDALLVSKSQTTRIKSVL
jgi:hypothetical protein